MSLLPPREDTYRQFDAELDLSYHIRVAMVGDAGVGKTSLLLKYSGDSGLSSPEHSVDSRTKMLIRNGHRIKLDIQDTAGLERYRSLTRSHYNAITGAVLVFDLTNEKSFQHMTYWYDELFKNTDKAVQAILIGTRCHKHDDREVTDESIKRLAEHLEVPYMEVSSEKNINVESCFETLVDKIIEKHWERVKIPGKEKIKLDHNPDVPVPCSQCCAFLYGNKESK